MRRGDRQRDGQRTRADGSDTEAPLGYGDGSEEQDQKMTSSHINKGRTATFSSSCSSDRNRRDAAHFLFFYFFYTSVTGRRQGKEIGDRDIGTRKKRKSMKENGNAALFPILMYFYFFSHPCGTRDRSQRHRSDTGLGRADGQRTKRNDFFRCITGHGNTRVTWREQGAKSGDRGTVKTRIFGVKENHIRGTGRHP